MEMDEANLRRIDTASANPFGIAYRFTLAVEEEGGSEE